MAEIEAYLADPPFRVWRPRADLSSQMNRNWLESQHAKDAQAMDILPIGQDGFRGQFRRCNGGRRLFVSKRLYMGLGAMAMQEGDEIGY